MAVETSLPALLTTLSQSLSSAVESVPEDKAILPPENGISLLDVKNDLFLSYLQNLVFLIILKLRNCSGKSDGQLKEGLDEAVVMKLVEMRVYLEKGVRPLEGRLKYQIDKVLRVADDAARASMPVNQSSNTAKVDSEEETDVESDAGSDAGAALKMPENVEDHQYRPGLLLTKEDPTAVEERSAQDGLYKPPRITATAMPTTTGPREKEAKKERSRTVEEYVNEEMSFMPEPSIGSHIVDGGRRSKSDKERKDEQERRDYEEKNYVRLPKLSKKDRAKQGRPRDAGYGGEEWRGLGEGIDRIERLTKRKAGTSSSVLDKSRKRPTEDGPRSSGGVEVGQRLQKRLKTLDGGRRDRGKK